MPFLAFFSPLARREIRGDNGHASIGMGVDMGMALNLAEAVDVDATGVEMGMLVA